MADMATCEHKNCSAHSQIYTQILMNTGTRAIYIKILITADAKLIRG